MVSLQRIAIPLFYNSDKDKEFSFNFRQRREAYINTDTRRFKIQTSDMGAPPGRASKYHLRHDLSLATMIFEISVLGLVRIAMLPKIDQRKMPLVVHISVPPCTDC